MRWVVVRTGLSRSWPSSGWTASPGPNIGEVAFDPSLELRPPQPPAIQSYHMKYGRPGSRPSRPPTSRYSRLKEHAMARSGTMRDQISMIEFINFSYVPEQNPVTAMGQPAFTTVPSGPRSPRTAR